MSNQARMPENVVALRRPDVGKVEPATRFRGAITNFRDPIHMQPKSVVVSPTTTVNNPPSDIIEGLFTDNNSTPEEGYSKEEMLAMALGAKKAA